VPDPQGQSGGPEGPAAKARVLLTSKERNCAYRPTRPGDPFCWSGGSSPDPQGRNLVHRVPLHIHSSRFEIGPLRLTGNLLCSLRKCGRPEAFNRIEGETLLQKTGGESTLLVFPNDSERLCAGICTHKAGNAWILPTLTLPCRRLERQPTLRRNRAASGRIAFCAGLARAAWDRSTWPIMRGKKSKLP